MVRNFDGGSALIEQWLKNKDTMLFLGVWEQLNNPGFNSLEFEGIKNEAGRNSFFLSAKKWIDATAAIGLHAKAGRYGDTYAHKDIAFEFGMWISAEFKLYLLKEFQRLKDAEARTEALEWNFQRTLACVTLHSGCAASCLTGRTKSKLGATTSSVSWRCNSSSRSKRARCLPWNGR